MTRVAVTFVQQIIIITRAGGKNHVPRMNSIFDATFDMWPPHFHSVSQSHSVTVAPLDEGVELTQLSAARLNRGSARTDAHLRTRS